MLSFSSSQVHVRDPVCATREETNWDWVFQTTPCKSSLHVVLLNVICVRYCKVRKTYSRVQKEKLFSLLFSPIQSSAGGFVSYVKKKNVKLLENE